MASVSTDSNGNRRILFTNRDGQRKTVYVGAMPKKQAETVCTKIEALNAAKVAGVAPADEVSRWTAGIGDDLHEKLLSIGLVEPRGNVSGVRIGEFVESFIAARLDVKPGTVMNYRACQTKLLAYFDANTFLASVTPLDADRFRSWLKGDKQTKGGMGLNENSVRSIVKNAKLIFGAAVKGRLLIENPFHGHKTAVSANKERQEFISRETFERVLQACPSSKWRAIASLCRFGGLRCPSEVLSLRWDDVDFERGRMRVRSSKTEAHDGGGIRDVPLFPEVRRALEELFLEPDGGELVIPIANRDRTTNLRTTFEKINRRAKVEPWGKLFQNLRSSRETELAQEHPIHLVVAWLGNSLKVAQKHYLQVRDEDFELASQPTRIPTQYTSADPGNTSQAVMPINDKTPVLQGFAGTRGMVRNQKVPPAGFEPAYQD